MYRFARWVSTKVSTVPSGEPVIKLITCIAVGWVVGQVLWEFLLAAAGWTGGAVVRAFASMMRLVMQERKATVITEVTE
jgi:hypothetical protein